MWKSGPEIPQVAPADVVDEVAALGVDARDAGAAGQHERPLSFFVPVQLSVCSGFQPHVHPGHGGGDGNSRTVTSRAQPPVWSRLCAAAKGNFRFGRLPESVAAAPGFCNAIATLSGPSIDAPRHPERSRPRPASQLLSSDLRAASGLRAACLMYFRSWFGRSRVFSGGLRRSISPTCGRDGQHGRDRCRTPAWRCARRC